MKICVRCGANKPVCDFNKLGSGLQSWCRSCQSEYRSAWGKSNKNKRAAIAKRGREKVRKYLQDLKDRTPCADCGVQYRYWVMDFDHVSDKDFALAKRNNRGMKRIKEEVAKCDIVCANCHRERTQARLN